MMNLARFAAVLTIVENGAVPNPPPPTDIITCPTTLALAFLIFLLSSVLSLFCFVVLSNTFKLAFLALRPSTALYHPLASSLFMAERTKLVVSNPAKGMIRCVYLVGSRVARERAQGAGRCAIQEAMYPANTYPVLDG